MAYITRLDPRPERKHKGAVAIDVVSIPAGVILRYEHHHLLPLRLLREELNNPSESKVIVSHKALRVGKAALWLWVGAMVIANGNIDKAWHFAAVHLAVFRDVINEPVGPDDIGDVVVERGEVKAGVVEEHLWHREVDQHICTGL